MDVTVILCTFNRCPILPKALESVAASVLPDTVQWEVLIVDNNSTDQTRGVVEEFCHRYPGRFRYLREPQQGLSRARNAGIQAAQGGVLAFMDDDVIVEPTWLQNLTAHLHSSQWVGAGGRVRLENNFVPPRWLLLEGPYSMAGSLGAAFDLGDQAGELDRPPFGTNMAFRKSMFEKHGGFRIDLGRSAKNMIGKEDTEFGERLMAAGERLWYAPSAIVFHPVPKERLTKKYFLAWWFGCGRSMVRERGKVPGQWGIPRYCLCMGMSALSALRWIRTLNPARRFFWKCWAWMYAGKAVENYCQSRPAKHADSLNS